MSMATGASSISFSSQLPAHNLGGVVVGVLVSTGIPYPALQSFGRGRFSAERVMNVLLREIVAAGCQT
jgi:hypothetical protein